MNRKRGGQQKDILPLSKPFSVRLTEPDYDNARAVDAQIMRAEIARLAAALAGAPPDEVDRIRARIGVALQAPR
jgi:hypothetical protein